VAAIDGQEEEMSMVEGTKDTMKGLAILSPEARRRVQASLAKAIDAKLAKGTALGGIPGVTHEFSSGLFSSRSHERVAPVHDKESRLLDHAALMDDATFAKFAERIARLKCLDKG
jgi:hypothetical protein